MKIAVVHGENIFKVSSASANRWRTMLEGLVKQGAEVHLIVTQGYRSIDEYRQVMSSAVFCGIRCHYTIFLLRNTYWARRIVRYVFSPLARPLNRLRLAQLLRRIAPDVVFLHPSFETFDMYSGIHSRNTGKYKLMIELNEFNDVADGHATNSLQLARNAKYNKLLSRTILPAVDLFVIMTRRLVDHYRGLAQNPSAHYLHLPMTVDLARFKDVQPAALRVPYIAYVGALNNKKDGIDILIKAFSRIAQSHDKWTLYLVGGYQHDVNIQRGFINELSLQGRVVYLGEKKRDEIPPILMGADLLVLPRPDSRQAQGGFPTKLGEYLASGNPVCATKVGEIPDYLTDNVNVYFAEAGDINSLTDAMLRALTNRTEARRIGLNGRQVAEKHFNMDIQAQILFDFLESNLEG